MTLYFYRVVVWLFFLFINESLKNYVLYFSNLSLCLMFIQVSMGCKTGNK